MSRKVYFSLIVILLFGLPMAAWSNDIFIDGDFSSTITAFAGFHYKLATPTGTITGTPTPVEIPAWDTWATGIGGPVPITTTVRRFIIGETPATPAIAVPIEHSSTPGAHAPAAQVGDMYDDKPTSHDDSYLEQTFTLPAECTTATLTAYCNFYATVFNGGSTEFHFQEVKILNEAGAEINNLDAQLKDSYGHTPLPTMVPNILKLIVGTADDEWWQYSFNLVAYSGQTLKLRFHVHDDGYGTQDAACMWVDDVSLDCITATPTATPTFTLTSTQSATHTITPTITQTSTVTPTYTMTPSITPTCTVTPVVIPYGKVIAYPNPASGRMVHFGYSLETPAHVYIDIYNLMGYQVAHLEDNYQPAQANRVTSWNIKSVAQGVYFFKVTLEGTDGRKTEMKKEKLVIVH